MTVFVQRKSAVFLPPKTRDVDLRVTFDEMWPRLIECCPYGGMSKVFFEKKNKEINKGSWGSGEGGDWRLYFKLIRGLFREQILHCIYRYNYVLQIDNVAF